MRKKHLFYSAAAFLVSFTFIIYSCGNVSTHTTDGASYEIRLPMAGFVRFAVTGDTSPFSQITATIEHVEIRNDATGAVCEIISVPSTINAADLAGSLQVIGLNKQCEPGLYTTIRLELNKNVEIMMNSETNVEQISLCSFTSYKDGSNLLQPLSCSGPLCTLDIKTDVLVPEGEHETVALFISTSAFDIVNINDPSTCSVSLKIVPASSEMPLQESLTGLVSDVSATTNSFSFARGADLYFISYSDQDFDQQPGFEALLSYAETQSLRTKVTSSLPMVSENIAVKAVYVKVDGIISGHDPVARTLTIVKGSLSTIVDYSQSVVYGILDDGACAKVRLYGSDGAGFLASRIDIQPVDDSAYG